MNLLDKINQTGTLISDGAWGTMLQARGLKPGECPESWNLNHEKEVFEIAENYVKAGADLIETNSFGGSRFKLKQYGLETKTSEINKLAAEISKKAAGDYALVLGSIGPTGKILMMGEVTSDELYDAFREQAVALENGGADAIIVETMTDLEEAIIAVKASKENTGIPVICTMTFEKTVDGNYRTMMGVAPEQIPEPLMNAGASVIGANCGNGMEGMIDVVAKLREVNTDIPILVHANAGIPVLKDGETVFPESPGEMSSFLPNLIKAGANIVGGCCGTTPEHISELKNNLK
jgi:5-methyltetrahydrofolate--homocysteine methyltransferase